MPTISKRGPIDAKWGYFYSLDVNHDSERFDEHPSNGKLSSVMPDDAEQGLVLVLTKSQTIYAGPCCAEHIFGWTRCVFDRLSGNETASIAWMNMGTDLVCKKELAFALVESGLVGVSISKAVFADPSLIRGDWYHVNGDGRPCIMQKSCEPAPYKCWNCGQEPICRICGRHKGWCPHCGEVFVVREKNATGENEKRLVIMDEPNHPYAIVDLNLWDGADYVGGQISHRMLQFLLSQHAHPFRVTPLAVNVHGATPKDLERLEIARTPIGQR